MHGALLGRDDRASAGIAEWKRLARAAIELLCPRALALDGNMMSGAFAAAFAAALAFGDCAYEKPRGIVAEPTSTVVTRSICVEKGISTRR